jgi:hypothetical protein
MKSGVTPLGFGSASERRRGTRVVEPGDRDRDLFERVELLSSQVGQEGGERSFAPLDGSGHGASVIETRSERKATLERDQTERRLEAHDPAARSGDADRSA